MKFGVLFRYKKLCGEPEFCENRLRNIRSLLWNVHEFLSVNSHVYLWILTRFFNGALNPYPANVENMVNS